jgi:hypothetical protein
MNDRHRQRGMTAISLAVIILVVLFFALVAIRLFPIYLENFKVESHLKNLAADRNIKTMSDRQILDTLTKRFDIDDVTNVTQDDIYIERNADKGGGMTLSAEYEVRTPMLGNVDLVVSFTDQVEVGG